MQLISKFDKEVCFLLCIIDIFSKCAQLILFKDREGIAITNDSQKFLDESNHKANKYGNLKTSNFIIDQRNHGQKKMTQKCIQDTMKENLLLLKIYQNLKKQNLHDINKCQIHDIKVNKYNNTYHRTMKIKPVDVKLSMCIDFSNENSKKVLNLKLMIMLEYQNVKIFLEIIFPIRF